LQASKTVAVYPEISNKMAMRIGKKYEPDHVFLRHWHQIVPNTLTAKKNINNYLINMSNDCIKQAVILQSELAKKGISSSIFDDILGVIESRRKHIQLEL
jgi:serine/threonine-protein kinase HipA